jgi:hypothetical protein
LDTFLSTLPLKRCFYNRGHVHYTLNDPMTIDFSNTKSSFIVVTEQGVESLNLDQVFSDHRTKHHHRRPYTGALYKSSSLDTPVLIIPIGSALARFERSTLPEHKGTRTIVLRFLKIITPVKCIRKKRNTYVGYIGSHRYCRPIGYPFLYTCRRLGYVLYW